MFLNTIFVFVELSKAILNRKHEMFLNYANKIPSVLLWT